MLPWFEIIRAREQDWVLAFRLSSSQWEEIVAGAYERHEPSAHEGYSEVSSRQRVEWHANGKSQLPNGRLLGRGGSSSTLTISINDDCG